MFANKGGGGMRDAQEEGRALVALLHGVLPRTCATENLACTPTSALLPSYPERH